MPSIPKYNQRSTNDINFAKKRVVNLEKEGITKLTGQPVILSEDANKIAELLIKSIEDLVVVIQRFFGFLENITEFNTDFENFDWNVLNRNDRPKIISLAVTSNLQLKRIVRIAKTFQKIYNFASPSNIQKLKDTLEDFENIAETYMEIILSVLNNVPEIDDDDISSIVSELSEELFEYSDSDSTDNFSTADDLLTEYNPDESETDTVSSITSDNISSLTSSSRRTFRPRVRITGYANEKQYNKIKREVGKNINDLFKIMNFIFDNYNEARNQLQIKMQQRENELEKEYVGSGYKKTYSVGNKYAEQLYNTAGMYH